MAFDQSKIGTLTAELMEALEQDFSEDSEIGDIALVVEITSPEQGSQVVAKYSSSRVHVSLGLLEVASRSLTAGN